MNPDYCKDYWMYFDFMYGILFDGRIPARQSLAQLRSSASHPTRHHTEYTEIRKSKICFASLTTCSAKKTYVFRLS